MNTFDEIVKTFPDLFEKLVNNKKFNFGTLTCNTINLHFKRKEPVSGVYLMTDKDNNPMYVGRSRHIAQRIGTDHRSTQKSQANLTHKYAKLNSISVLDARGYMFENYYVQMVEIENEHARTLFEVYAAMKLNTPFNSFRES